MAAVEYLGEGWGTFARREGLHCSMNVVVHKGTLYAFRSYLYSRDLNLAVRVESATQRVPPRETSIFVTGQVRQDLVGSPCEEWLQPLDGRLLSPPPAEIEIHRLS
jgi:hypothetical protein